MTNVNAKTSCLNGKRLPAWLRKRLVVSEKYAGTAGILDSLGVVTVCREAKCPNLNECWNSGTATFMIMGELCTRQCSFCAVGGDAGAGELDDSEPRRVGLAVKGMGLEYAVVTSVTRDDLADGGAEHFAQTIGAIRAESPGCKVEVLTPDFGGRRESVELVCSAGPEVYNHNLETIERLSEQIRSGADYRRSLEVLRWAKEALSDGWTKSGLMVGLGETDEEVFAAMSDLREAGCELLTVGQYLRPTAEHMAVARYVEPEVFSEYERVGRELGFVSVAAGPFVRSSYRAGELSGCASKVGKD